MSGTEQHSVNSEERHEELSSTQILQALLTDREEERRLERVRHEGELTQCKEERRIQLDLMKALIEGTTQAPLPRQSHPKIVFRKLTDADDIEAYLTTFEQLMTSTNLERQH